MPTPAKNEKKGEYISRCIKQVMGEGKTQDQAVGQCEGRWRDAKKAALPWAKLRYLAELMRKEGLDSQNAAALSPQNLNGQEEKKKKEKENE
jgi:hypothetical protein